MPRNSVIGTWVCPLMNPGSTSLFFASIVYEASSISICRSTKDVLISSFVASHVVDAPTKGSYEDREENACWYCVAERNLAPYGFYQAIDEQDAPHDEQAGTIRLRPRSGNSC